jgi:protoporphyrinogen oxidase
MFIDNVVTTVKILIIGAGPCGLGAAHRLNELGHDNWLLMECNGHVGGLSASFEDARGFTWDIGGHVLFSHYDYFDRVVEQALAGEYYEHLRESWVRILQSWVPYPFQNNIRYLPDEALQECLEGLRQVRSGATGESANFCEWLGAVFGRGIVKHFMEPYNRKVWGVPLESMDKEWIAERVSVPDLVRIERNLAEQRADVSWGPNNRFKFPRHGGTGAIFEGIARPLRQQITLNKKMVSVDLEHKEVIFADGERVGYDLLINTSPVDTFVRSCVTLPDAVRHAADGLVHNGGLIAGIGLAGKRSDPKCWMYFPEENCPFYRVTNFFNYSPFNVPDGRIDTYYSLMCETTYSPTRLQCSDTIVAETVDGLIASGLLEEADRERIVSTWLIDIPYSYPVPTLGRDRALAIIQQYLESRGVFSRGRFGAWKYEVGNMDHSFMQGVEVVDRLLAGKIETTITASI